MTNKEETEPDYSYLNKYFIDDSKSEKTTSVKVNTIIEDVSINESFQEFIQKEKDDEPQMENNETETPGKDTKSRKEFIKSTEDDSLTLDICSNVSRDWN